MSLSDPPTRNQGQPGATFGNLTGLFQPKLHTLTWWSSPDDRGRLMTTGDSCVPQTGCFTPKRLPADHLPGPARERTSGRANQPSWEHPLCPPKCNGGAGPWN
ncbi:hypothetical protein AVEN_87196-1 [Araneus ventricosus]|uniref:Uncharacterized protein n=1 Tax=Araneus ventricosus TaxID=182803 RepID=A0A4Y2TG41_ARAVE|nr:hypothetical protein AVEN_87196-1 [Araneus ventricosus]